MSAWQPIESAPKDGSEILTFRQAKLMAVAIWFPDLRRWCVSDGGDIVGVTHWMPLPEPPESEGT